MICEVMNKPWINKTEPESPPPLSVKLIPAFRYPIRGILFGLPADQLSALGKAATECGQQNIVSAFQLA